uniref:Pentatricopeptide repeat-containing protein n=1 Tax=Ananas comosus var. bracteatus TaxID=296719 RepID=A0A6V7NI27_ANACO|nr:unnamed protein product [Ananas comosus var. bracteatus]
MARVGLEPGLFMDNQFINLYAKCGEIEMARALFDGMKERNVVSWNALLAGYCLNKQFLDAVKLFRTMAESGPSPNYVTYLSALRASVGLGNVEVGKQIHSRLIKTGFISRIEVGNAMINTYSELGLIEESEAVYNGMAEKDVVSWNSLISAKVQNQLTSQALLLFIAMQIEGYTPDEFTFASLLGPRDMAIAEELHAQISKRELAGMFAGSALLDAYARVGNPRAAVDVFNSMTKRSIVTWNSVIDACFKNNMADEGLKLFLQMSCEQSVLPDEYTIAIMLKGAASELMIGTGKSIHGLAVKMGRHTETTIGNNLIAMYGRHEAVSDSWQAFTLISEPDIVSWNSIVQSYIKNGKFERGLILFVEMKLEGIEPDELSFVAALNACASLTRYTAGKEVHGELIKRGISSNAFIESALIDMYAKSMAINDAKKHVRIPQQCNWESKSML